MAVERQGGCVPRGAVGAKYDSLFVLSWLVARWADWKGLRLRLLVILGFAVVGLGGWFAVSGQAEEGVADNTRYPAGLLASEYALYSESNLAGRLEVVSKLADLSLESGLFDRVVDSFLVGEGLLPDQFEYHVLRGEMFYRARDYRRARKEWLLAQEIVADNEHLILRLYQMAEVAGEREEAVRLGRIFHRLSSGPRSALCLARALVAVGETEEAFDVLELAGRGIFSEFDEFRLLIRYAIEFEVLDRLVVMMDEYAAAADIPPAEKLAIAEMWIAAGEIERARDALWSLYTHSNRAATGLASHRFSGISSERNRSGAPDTPVGGQDDGATLRNWLSVVRQRYDQIVRVSGPGGLAVSREKTDIPVGLRLRSFVLLALISDNPEARFQLVDDLSEYFATHRISLGHQAEAWIVLRELDLLHWVVREMIDDEYPTAERYRAMHQRLLLAEEGRSDAAAAAVAADIQRLVAAEDWQSVAGLLVEAFGESVQPSSRRLSVQRVLARPLHNQYLSEDVLRLLQYAILLSVEVGIQQLDAAFKDIQSADPGVELPVLALRYYLAWAGYDDLAAVEIAGRYLDLDSNDALRYDRALILRDLGRLDEAIAELKRIESSSDKPVCQAAQIRLVQLLLAGNDLDGARGVARQLVESGPPQGVNFENTLRSLGITPPKWRTTRGRAEHYVQWPQNPNRRKLHSADVEDLLAIGGERPDDVQLQRIVIGRLLNAEDQGGLLAYLDANPTVSVLAYIDQQSVSGMSGPAQMSYGVRVAKGFCDVGRVDDFVTRLLWEHHELHGGRPFVAGISHRELENVIEFLYEQGEYQAAALLFERLSLGRQPIRLIQYHRGSERLFEIYIRCHEMLDTKPAEVASRMLTALAAARWQRQVPRLYGVDDRPSPRSGMFSSQNSHDGLQNVALLSLFDRIQSPEILRQLVDQLDALPIDDSENAFGYERDRDVLAAYVAVRTHASDALDLVRLALQPASHSQGWGASVGDPNRLSHAVSNVLKDRALSIPGGYRIVLEEGRGAVPYRPRWLAPGGQPVWGDFMLDFFAAMRALEEDDIESARILLNRALLRTGALGDVAFRNQYHFRLWAEVILGAGLADEMEGWLQPVRVADSLSPFRRIGVEELVEGWVDVDDGSSGIAMWPDGSAPDSLLKNPELRSEVDPLTGAVSIPGWSLPPVLPLVTRGGPSRGYPVTYLTPGATYYRVTLASDPMPIDPESTYRLSCWVDFLGATLATIGIQFLDSAGQPIGDVRDLRRPPNPVWEFVEREFGPEVEKIPPPGNTAIMENWCGAFPSTTHVRTIPPNATAARVVIDASPLLRIAHLSFLEVAR